MTFARLDPTARAPGHDAPAPDRGLSGTPRFTTWTLKDRDGRFS